MPEYRKEESREGRKEEKKQMSTIMAMLLLYAIISQLINLRTRTLPGQGQSVCLACMRVWIWLSTQPEKRNKLEHVWERLWVLLSLVTEFDPWNLSERENQSLQAIL